MSAVCGALHLWKLMNVQEHLLAPPPSQVILPAAQAVLQGRSFKKLVPKLSVAPETWHFTNELQMQIRLIEFPLPA